MSSTNDPGASRSPDGTEHGVDPESERHDEAWKRLRAADPAGQEAPDLVAIDQAVRERIGGTAGGGSTAEVTAPADELAARRTRRRRTPARIAAVAAGALLLAGGGYAVGQVSEPSPAQAPIVLGGAGATGSSSEAAASGPGLTAAVDSIGPGSMWNGGRTVFRSVGLSANAGTAKAYAYDAASVFSQEAAERVAAALGMTGEPRLEYGTYFVGPSDQTGPTMSLQPDGLASISFNDPTRDPWACETDPDTPEASSSDPGSGSMPPVPPECGETNAGQGPSDEDAVAEFKRLMTAIGVDPGRYEFEVEEANPRSRTGVVAWEVIDGQRTGSSWNALFSSEGLFSLNGTLAPVVPLGEYDVTSPATAADRLDDPRFGSWFGGPLVVDAAASATSAREGAASAPDTATAEPAPADPTVPATVSPGSPIAWPVTDVTITGARLGLAVSYQPDGAALLLPAYELTDNDGETWSVIAVADEALDFTP